MIDQKTRDTEPPTLDKLRFTLFPAVHASSKTEHDLSLEALSALLKEASADTKDALPLISCGIYGKTRTAAGALRSQDNLTAVCGVEGDYDAGEVSPFEAYKLLRAAGVAAVVYTSPSHTTAKPRWRVICPLKHPVHPSERKRLVSRLNGVLGGILSRESFVLSQSFYIGHVRNVPFEQLISEGDPIDELHQLGDGIYPHGHLDSESDSEADQRTSEQLLENIAAGRYLHESLLVLSARMIGRGMTPASTTQALRDAMQGSQRRIDDLSSWQARVREIPRLVSSAVAKYGDSSLRVDPWQALDDFDTIDEPAPAKTEPPAAEQPEVAKEPKPAAISSRLVRLDLTSELRPMPSLIRGVLLADSLTMVWGEPSACKSFITLDWALCIASGTDWLGHRTKPGNVWYLAGEGQAGLNKRVRAWQKQRNVTNLPVDRFLYSPTALQLDRMTEGQISPEVRDLVRMIREGYIPSLVVIDTLNRSMVGDENSSQDTAIYLGILSRLQAEIRKRNQNCCFIIVHHARKDGAVYRGSTALRGAADSEYEVERATLSEDDAPDVAALRLTCRKYKDAQEPHPLDLIATEIDLGTAIDDFDDEVRMTSLVVRKAGAGEGVTAQTSKLDEKKQEQLLSAITKVLATCDAGLSMSKLQKAVREAGVSIKNERFAIALDEFAAQGKVQLERNKSTGYVTVRMVDL